MKERQDDKATMTETRTLAEEEKEEEQEEEVIVEFDLEALQASSNEDLRQHQGMGPLSPPDELEQVSDHGAPPRRASTGFIRDIRHAG